MTDIYSKRAATEWIAIALLCHPCWVSCFHSCNKKCMKH